MELHRPRIEWREELARELHDLGIIVQPLHPIDRSLHYDPDCLYPIGGYVWAPVRGLWRL